jgi:hypothetical protein
MQLVLGSFSAHLRISPKFLLLKASRRMEKQVHLEM